MRGTPEASGLLCPSLLNETARLAAADVGDRLCVPGIDFSRAEAHLVLGTSPVCPACQLSSRFYSALGERAQKVGLPLYVLAQGPVRPNQTLPSFTTQVVTVNLKSVGMVRTPSVAMVDSQGVITAMSTGLVANGREAAVLDELMAGASSVSSRMKSISVEELRSIQVSEPVQLVDPGETAAPRSESPLSQEVRIPWREIGTRAPYELDRNRLIVVDCRVVGALQCQNAMIGLRSARFPRVAGLNLRALGESPACRSN